MKQIYYSFKALYRDKGATIIKILSLAIGLIIGIQIFVRITFDMNYDNFYSDAENLFIIRSSYFVNGVELKDNDRYIYGPMPAAIKENFPDEVQSATIIRQFGDDVFYYGNHRFADIRMIYADQFLFETLGLPVLEGNTDDLANVDMVFISESFAHKISGGDNVIGKTLNIYKTYPVTIKGVFKDVPENTDFRFDLVCSFVTANKRGDGRRAGWGYDMSYTGFVRFYNPGNASEVEARLPQMLGKYTNHDESAEKYTFQQIGKYHNSNEKLREMALIVSSLGFIILLIAVMNYVLISVSSLPGRARKIAVFRCNGASSGDIRNLFLWETAIIVFVAILITLFVIINFKGFIENKLGASYATLFAPYNLWPALVAVLIVFLVGGLLPGKLFSDIPVHQVYSKYTDKKSAWKKGLLFIQFTGVTFALGILAVVLIQYNEISRKDLGYKPDMIVTSYHTFPDVEQAKSNIRNLPMVEDVAACSSGILDGYSGENVTHNGELLFSMRLCWIDYNYVPLMNIKITEGRNVRENNELLVNKEFVKRMPWTDTPIGKQVYNGDRIYGTVVGVMEDFPIRSYYSSIEPVLMVGTKDILGYYSVKLKEPFDKNIESFNQQIAEIYPTNDIVFSSLKKDIDSQYTGIRNFRDLSLSIFVSVFFITFLGLIGYINDEIRRRSKEIGIRKVNGAGVRDILMLIAEDIMTVALPAVMVGIVAAYYIGKQWLNQFEGHKMELNIPTFIIIGIIVLLIIGVTLVLRALHVARENPVKSIKTE